eukprot:CAMPEP_0196678098 /NCGR_PEP_ID=MMETSP1090-20130531/6107_1 /TAXON_ID=37098 /ORGANISM="Isochrysis sp, Strain CCMP1244" /LENGTH=136 /DNA_ID=CAMNT_0042016231 /DNA_START=635 /DNA_END=1046 /DNA_ORIENTATION=-
MKMPICAVLLGAAHAAAFATGGACVDMKPALLKKFFEDEIAKLPEEQQMQQQMQVVEAKIPGTCEEVKAAEGCKFVTKECCATCGDVAPDIQSQGDNLAGAPSASLTGSSVSSPPASSSVSPADGGNVTPVGGGVP